MDGHHAGDGLIMETEVLGGGWGATSDPLSDKESPLPLVLLCLIQHLIRDGKSKLSYHVLMVKGGGEWRSADTYPW